MQKAWTTLDHARCNRQEKKVDEQNRPSASGLGSVVSMAARRRGGTGSTGQEGAGRPEADHHRWRSRMAGSRRPLSPTRVAYREVWNDTSDTSDTSPRGGARRRRKGPTR
jgi:hypothetical protein